jgi:capsular exopolysaccharide synthesis family protein
MSKVHEALKRAEEERSSATLHVGESLHKVATPEVSAPILVPTSEDEDRSPKPILNGSGHNELTALREVPAIDMGPSRGREDGSLNSPSPAAKTVIPPPERRLHTPATGRDPRTGQFLRFEDLLKNCAEPAWVLDPKTVMFAAANESSSGAEQFRTLRSRLYQLREATSLKRILITSALAGEGKTFVATNLGQAISREKERKVLLIDADLRSPALHRPLAAPLTPGLSDYLRGEASDPEIIQHGQEGNLCFIPAGNPGSDPSELLSNGALEKLLERLTPLFDWVIIDSPPCLPVADANVLAAHCDGVLLVLRARSTPSAAADRARKELQKRKVIGVVMNAVEEAETYGGYYGYGKQNGATQ